MRAMFYFGRQNLRNVPNCATTCLQCIRWAPGERAFAQIQAKRAKPWRHIIDYHRNPVDGKNEKIPQTSLGLRPKQSKVVNDNDDSQDGELTLPLTSQRWYFFTDLLAPLCSSSYIYICMIACFELLYLFTRPWLDRVWYRRLHRHLSVKIVDRNEKIVSHICFSCRGSIKEKQDLETNENLSWRKSKSQHEPEQVEVKAIFIWTWWCVSIPFLFDVNVLC